MKNKYKILIVGAYKEELAIHKNYLDIEDFRVEISLGAANALVKMKDDRYHIVLINIEMPDMDGLELLKKIRSNDPMTQIIMMTEDSTMEKILRSLECGANDYIYQPLKRPEYVINLIDYSIQKLERWREAMIQIVKTP